MSGTRRLGWMLMALLAGCSALTAERDVPISPKYPLPLQPSPECIAAAKRASRWCVPDPTVNTDATFTAECTAAEWDYRRYC